MSKRNIDSPFFYQSSVNKDFTTQYNQVSAYFLAEYVSCLQFLIFLAKTLPVNERSGHPMHGSFIGQLSILVPIWSRIVFVNEALH